MYLMMLLALSACQPKKTSTDKPKIVTPFDGNITMKISFQNTDATTASLTCRGTQDNRPISGNQVTFYKVPAEKCILKLKPAMLITRVMASSKIQCAATKQNLACQ